MLRSTLKLKAAQLMNPAMRRVFAFAPRQPKRLERTRIHLRTRHDSIRTEDAYIGWARRFIVSHGKRHRHDLGATGRPVRSCIDFERA